MCPSSIDQVMSFVNRMAKVGDMENVGVLGLGFLQAQTGFMLAFVVLSII